MLIVKIIVDVHVGTLLGSHIKNEHEISGGGVSHLKALYPG